MRIEVEQGEIAVRNTNGDFAIIPKNKREEVIAFMDEGNHNAIDKIISKLPLMSDYAEDGTLMPDSVPDLSTAPIRYSRTREISANDLLEKLLILNIDSSIPFEESYAEQNKKN